MKRFYKFLMPLVAIVAMALPWNARAQVTVTIGDGGTTTSSYLPMYTLYNNTLSEQIYTASEIGMAGNITSISFYNGGSTKTPNVKIYMINTNRTDFSSTTDWLPVTASDLVFQGNVTFTAGQWTTITLDNPFMYDGASNLGLVFDGNMSWSSGLSCRVFSSTSNCAMYVYSDGTDYNAVGATYTASSRLSVKNQIQLEILPSNMSCYPVRNLTASNIGPWSCTLTWSDTSNSGATYTVISLPDSTVLSSGITDTTVDLTGLTADYSHIFGVIADCGGGDESMARSITVHTLVSCPNPTLLTLDSITPTDAYIHWTPGLNETEWYLTIGDSAVGSITDTFYTITDLNPNTVYNLHLRAVCGADDSSIVTSLFIHTLAGEPISTFPYTCGFELTDDGDQAADWMLENIGQTNQWYVGAPGAHSGTKGLFISNDNGASNAYDNGSTSYVFAYATFSFEAGEYTYSYDWLANGESCCDFIRAAVVPDSVDFTAGSYCGFSSSADVPAGGIAIDGGGILNQQSSWQNRTGSFTIATEGLYKVVFLWRNDGSVGTNPPAAIDNIAISLNTCPAPVDLTIDSLMPSAIDLHWTTIGEESEWAILIGDSLITGITDTFYTVTGLDQYTLYTMRVYAVCGTDDTSLASDPVTGRTTVSCPWPESLTATATGGDTVTVTWTAGNGSTATDYYLVYGTTGFNPTTVGESNWIQVNGTTSYEITGLTAGLWDIYVRSDCGGDDGISAWAGPASVGIGYINIDQVDTLYTCGAIICDNGGPNGNYTASRDDQVVIYPVDSQHGLTISGTSYTEGSYDYLTIYEGVGTSGTILFQDNTSGVSTQLTVGPFDVEGPITVKFHSDASVYYDGFQITVNCFDMSGCVRPSNLVCTSFNSDSVAISWNGNGASGWEVFVGPSGAQPDADSAIAVTDSNYVFTTLSGGVAYDIYVRSDCGGDYSDWRGPLTVTPGTYIMSATGSDTITMCGGIIYDNGGANGQYTNNCNSTLVVNAVPGNRMTISGSYSGEDCCDYLKIFDGVGTSGTPLNTTQYGSFTVGPYISTTGAFTIQFTSDVSSVGDGFALNITCESLACPLAGEIHAEQVSSGTAILGYTIMGITDTLTYDDLTLILTSAADTMTLHPTSDNMMVVTGLDTNTTYVAQLFTTCGGVETDTVTCSFTTTDLPCAVIDPALSDTVIFTNSTTGISGCLAYSSWGNTVYQAIYTAAELTAAGVVPGPIIGIDLGFTASTSYAKEFTIFMGNTSTTSISDAIIENPQTLVYGPSAHPTGTSGWQHYDFTIPFVWDGVSSILLTTFMNQPTGQSQTSSSGLTGYYVSANNTARYRYRDSQQWTTNNLTDGNSGSTYSYRAAIHFYTQTCIMQATCAAPLVMLDSTTSTTAVVNIYPGYHETSWMVEYRLVGDATWTMAGTASASPYTVTGLQSGKHYEIRVSSVCDSASFGTTVAATTQCAVVAVTPTTPYFENFEGGAPVCWTQEYVHGQYNWLLGSETYVYHNSTYQHGEGAAELYQQSNTSDTAVTKLITDAFNFTALTNGARLRFYNAQLQYQTYGQPTLYLYYRTSSTDSWTVFDSIVTAVTDLTQHQFILPNSASAPYYQIAFEGHCPYGYGLNVDDVLIDANPACNRPIITSTIPNGATATITWTGNANNYTVSYHPFYDTVAAWTNVAVTGTTATLTGLTTGTYYEVTVTGDCGATDGLSDPSAPVFFYVPCAGQTIPYTENFNSYTNDLCYIANSSFVGFDNYPYVQLPNCWMFPNQSHQGISPAALLFSDSANAFPTNCLWINARMGRDHYSVLPLMDAPIDTLVLLFDYILSSESMVVGVVTDPNDVTTFIGLDTITDATGSVEHYFSTDNVTWNAGQDYYIALHTFGSYYAFVDNVQVVYQPNCMKVANVHQVNAGENTVTIDWTNSSTGATPVAYQIGYAVQGSNTVNYTVTTSKPATISGLASLTTYMVAVRPICGVGDTAFWSDAAMVSTEACDGATVASTGAATETSYYTPLNNYYNYTLTQTIIDSAELVGIGEIGTIAYSYNYSSPSTLKTNVTIWMQPTTKSTFSSESDVVALDTTIAVQVYNGALNCSQGWNYFALSTPFTWDGHSNLLVIVDDNSGDYDGMSYVFDVSACTGYKTIQYYSDSYNPDINNLSGFSGNKNRYEYRATMKLISCGGSACPAPVVASVTNDYQSATITVTGTGNGYELSYGTDPSALGNTMTSTTGVFNLTGLVPATQYHFEVVQLCDSGEVSTPAYGIFTTDDLPCFTPTDLNIVATTFASATLGWTSAGSATQWVIEVNGAGLQRFDTVGTNPYTITGLYANQQYTAAVRAICLMGTVESDWSDTITFTTDACAPVQGVEVSGITTNSATVSWMANNGVMGYKISYGDSNFYDNEAIVADVDANTTSYTMTGLEEESAYEVYVQTKCAEGVFSVVTAADRVSFRTTAGGSEGIYDAESGTLTLFPNPASTSVTVTVSGMEGEVTVEIVDLNGRTSGKWTVESGKVELDLSGMAQGAYFVRVTGERQTVVRKLIVR